jgi:hypothetical protein
MTWRAQFNRLAHLARHSLEAMRFDLVLRSIANRPMAIRTKLRCAHHLDALALLHLGLGCHLGDGIRASFGAGDFIAPAFLPLTSSMRNAFGSLPIDRTPKGGPCTTVKRSHSHLLPVDLAMGCSPSCPSIFSTNLKT